MTLRLLDADICIDVLRDHTPTIEWLKTLDGAVAVPGIAALELYQGCRDKQATAAVEKLLRRFTIIWPAADDYQFALGYYPVLHLSHNIGIFDALIAATAIGLDAVLDTFNTKHFEAIPAVKVEKPYQK